MGIEFRRKRLAMMSKSPLDKLARRESFAFTLVELLVVVSIISLLVAILLPGLRKARQQAKIVKCQANLRQLELAWRMYLDDQKGFFLKGVNADINYGGKQGSVRSFRKPKPLNLFVKLPEVTDHGADLFFCPADRGSRTIKPTFFDRYGTSYRMNIFLVGQDSIFIPNSDPCKATVMTDLKKNLKKMKRSHIRGDSRLILMGDFGWYNTWNRQLSPGEDWHGRPCTHNVVFMDGHTSFLRIRKGIHTSAEYTVIPFKNLQQEAANCQEEVDCE